MRQQLGQQCLRLRLMRRQGGFRQGDGFRQCAPLASQNIAGQRSDFLACAT